MATVLLRDLMNTKYMIQSLAGRFENCLQQCKQNGDVVDLNGCRLGPNCAAIMYKYYKDVDFCNSEDAYLDSVLKNNCLAAREVLEDYPELDLTHVEDIGMFLELSNILPTGAKYNPKVSLGSIRSKALLVMLIMARPDIEFDIRSCASDVFEFVRDLWIIGAKHHDAYLELIAPNITTRTMNEDGLYGSEDRGFLNEDDFIRTRLVLPAEFGSEQIIKLDANESTDEEWYPIVEKCVNCFETASKTKRVPGKTIKDFLTFRED